MSHQEILNSICAVLSVSLDDLNSTTRKKHALYARKLSVYYLNIEVADPQIIAQYFRNSISLKTIYRYRNNFNKELRYDKTLKYYKSQCDAVLIKN